MRKVWGILALLLCVCVFKNNAQSGKALYGAGRYALDRTQLCTTADRVADYYSMHIKYPLSSMRLAERARAEIKFPEGFTGSGYIIVRFVVNCRRELSSFYVYETDAAYKSVHFADGIREQALAFVKSLKDWPAGMYDGKGVDYFAFIAIKIKNGRVENIIP